LDGFVILIRNQSTSETKIKDKQLVYNSRTAHFNIFGNYFSVRKSAMGITGVFPYPVVLAYNNLIIKQKF
jgi:hypothetical protein